MFYNISFKDPSTVYAYSLVFVHHQVMWFMFIILGVVYWSFYKIVKEYNWNSFNKQGGILYTVYYADEKFMKIELIISSVITDILLFLWSQYLVTCSTYWITTWLFFSTKKRNVNQSTIEKLESKHSWSRLTLSLETLTNYYFKGNLKKSHYSRKPVSIYEEAILSKYFYYSSFNRTNYAYMYSLYSKEDKDFLTVQNYRDNLYLELIWAFFPSLVIFLILIPSLYLLYSLEENIQPKFNIKVIGHQWFWSYEFDSLKYDLSFEFDSTLLLESDLVPGNKRLLEVSNRLYLPVNVPLRILVTSGDVLHSWAVPEMGIKVDAVPGRLNDCVTIIRRPGVFYGQCSELCGVGHGFMPIVVEAVSYKKWMATIISL